jgi:hypothetical protein
MELSRYVQEIQENLVSAAELATGGSASSTTQGLLASHAAASRMVLLSALSDAIATINTALDGAQVEIRLRGREPEFVVVQPSDESAPNLGASSSEQPHDVDHVAQGGQRDFDARVTLRMPGDLKVRISQRARMRNVSMNTWLVQLASKNV